MKKPYSWQGLASFAAILCDVTRLCLRKRCVTSKREATLHRRACNISVRDRHSERDTIKFKSHSLIAKNMLLLSNDNGNVPFIYISCDRSCLTLSTISSRISGLSSSFTWKHYKKRCLKLLNVANFTIMVEGNRKVTYTTAA